MEIINVKDLDGSWLIGRTQVSSEGDYVKDGKLYYGDNIRSVMLESEDQLGELPSDLYAPGSVAYLAGMTKAWQMTTDGTWTVLIGGD